MRRIVMLAAAVGLLATATTGTAEARTLPDVTGGVAVSGAVARATTYTPAELRALPQTTLPVPGGSVSGVAVRDLVLAAAPVLPESKNAALRVRVTVSGATGARTLALGELDPGFGNHPALLALRAYGFSLPGGPWLVLPADRGIARTVIHVTRLEVAVANPAPASPVAGSVVVRSGTQRVPLTAATLAALPRQTRTVTYTAGGVPETHTESGPALADVLLVARVRTGPTTAVTAVATDGYAATVTPAEATSGRRPLLLSLVEDGTALSRPRLVPAGDLKGGRYVSGTVALDVTRQR